MKTTPLFHAWNGIWRLAARRHFNRMHWLALAGMLAILAVIFWAFLRAGNGAREFLPFTVAFYFTFLIPLLAFTSGGGAWRDELKPEAADYFLNRPVPKGRYLLFRYGAHLMCAEIDFACALALLAGIAAARHVPGLAGALPLMLLAQLLAVAAFSAFGFFCAAFTSRWLILGIVYGAVVEVGIGNVPLQVNRLAMSHQVRAMLHRISTRAWTGAGSGAGAEAARTWAAAGFLVLFCAAWILLGAARFSRAELAGAKPEEL